MAIADLHPHAENPNRGDIVTIAESLKQFGQYRSVVANKDGTILAGHHVVQAARSIRMPTLRVDMVDADEQSARKIMLADNRIADLGPGPDMEALLEVLLRVDDLEGTGFDDDYIRMLEEMNEGAPDLETLEDEVGPPSKEDFYRRVMLTLDPRLATRWERYVKEFPNDTEALAALMNWTPET
jgi:ParB-like chromosome segregation protein Spo0J